MKKIIVAVLTLALLLCGALAVAEEDAGGFNGVAWLTNYPETVNALGGRWYVSLIEPAYSIEHMMYNRNDYLYNADISISAYADLESNGMQVEGYDVTVLSLRFVFVPDESGMLPGDEDHTALYYAEYRIIPEDVAAAYDDLTGKFAAQYGEANVSTSEGTNSTSTFSVWYSAEDTMLSVRKDEYTSGSGSICISYGYVNANTLLQEAVFARELEQRMLETMGEEVEEW